MPGSVAWMRARVIHCVDAHAEGEPSRIIVGGVLDVPGTTMLEKARWLEREGDWLRRLCLFEPRGSAPLSADLVLPSVGARGRRRLHHHGVLVLRGHVGDERDQHRGRAARDRHGRRWSSRRPRWCSRRRRAWCACGAACSGGRVDGITFENVPSFCTALDAVVEVPDVGTLRSISPTAAHGARSWTRPRWASRSCPTRRARSASWASDPPAREPSSSRSCTRSSPTLQLPVVRRLRRAAAGRRRRPARDDRLPRPARPLARPAPRPRPASRCSSARGTMGDDVRRRERDRHALHGPRGGPHDRSATYDAVVPAITGRAWITGFHQLVARPDRPARRRLQAAGHLGLRQHRGHAQPLKVVTVTETVTRAGPWRSWWCAFGPIATSGRDVIEVERELDERLLGRLAEVRDQPLALLGMHLQQPELVQMALGRRDHDESSRRA